MRHLSSHDAHPGSTPRGRVSVVGLGPMGLPLARTLLRAGWETSGWNRSPGPMAAFVECGGAAASLSELPGDVVLAVLPDVDQLRDVLDHGLRERLAARSTPLVVMSTTSPEKITALAQELAQQAIPVVDAPMSGGVAGAESGTLSIMVGAEPADYRAVHSVLASIGTTVELLGPVGSGTLAKLCNQLIVAGTLSAVAESLGLATAAGLDGDAMLRLLTGGLADSAVLRAKGPRILARDYDSGGSARNQLKDLRYATATARTRNLPTPIGDVAAILFERAVAEGFGDADHSVVAEVLREPNA